MPPNSDLVVTLDPVEADGAPGSVTVVGNACNAATAWRAINVRVGLQFYDQSVEPTADAGSLTLTQIPPGECLPFTAALAPLVPWSIVAVNRIEWLWDLTTP